jgi:hypothetical protein
MRVFHRCYATQNGFWQTTNDFESIFNTQRKLHAHVDGFDNFFLPTEQEIEVKSKLAAEKMKQRKKNFDCRPREDMRN